MTMTAKFHAHPKTFNELRESLAHVAGKLGLSPRKTFNLAETSDMSSRPETDAAWHLWRCVESEGMTGDKFDWAELGGYVHDFSLDAELTEDRHGAEAFYVAAEACKEGDEVRLAF